MKRSWGPVAKGPIDSSLVKLSHISPGQRINVDSVSTIGITKLICGIFIPIVIIQHLVRFDSLLFLLVSSRFGFIKPWEKGKRSDHYI